MKNKHTPAVLIVGSQVNWVNYNGHNDALTLTINRVTDKFAYANFPGIVNTGGQPASFKFKREEFDGEIIQWGRGKYRKMPLFELVKI